MSEYKLFKAMQGIMRDARDLDDARSQFHAKVAEMYPFEFEIEQSDKQREWDWKANREKEAEAV